MFCKRVQRYANYLYLPNFWDTFLFYDVVSRLSKHNPHNRSRGRQHAVMHGRCAIRHRPRQQSRRWQSPHIESHPSSLIPPPLSSFIIHPSSFIIHPSSFILHPSSLIPPLSSFSHPPDWHRYPERYLSAHQAH